MKALNVTLIARKTLLSTLASAAVLSGLAACSSPDQSIGNNMIDVGSIRAAAISPVEKSQKLAEASEQLVSPSGFIYADMVADEALAQDPNNAKARLIKALLGPSIAMRGIMNRVAPLMQSRPLWNRDYQRAIADIKRQNPEKAVTEFLFDGPQDIRTEADIQELVASVTVKLDELRRTLKELKDEEITIRVNADSYKKSALEQVMKSCYVQQASEGVFSLENCDYSSAYEVKLNRADFEALQHVVAGYQVYITLLNSWKLNGAISVGEKIARAEKAARYGRGTQPSSQAVVDELLKNPEFGTLREANGMGVIPETAKDLVIGVRYALQAQGELCGEGPYAENRPGYLIKSGICVEPTDAIESHLRAVELMLSGTPVIFPVKVRKQDLPVAMDPVAFFTHPIQDVRTLLPVKHNECGHVVGLGDGTAGGLFPNGDLNTLLTENAAPSSCYPRY